MKKDIVLQKSEAAVAAVEAKLTEFDKLTAEAAELTAGIEKLKQCEIDVLTAPKSEAQKVANLTKLRLTTEVKAAALSKLRADISQAREEARSAAIRASLWLGALSDALVAKRRKNVSEVLKALFVKQAHFELNRFLDFSIPVDEILNGIGRLCELPASNMEKSLATCRKVRSTFEALKSPTIAEPDFDEIIASESW